MNSPWDLAGTHNTVLPTYQYALDYCFSKGDYRGLVMAIFHVMMRGNHRKNIFFDNSHYEQFLTILKDGVSKHSFDVLGYCLMTNHIHLLLQGYESLLPELMWHINFRYARYINQKRKRRGHLFQDRYKAIRVQDEKYLLNLCRYIHLNPVEAKMVTCPAQYRWSSHHAYLQNNTEIRIKTELILQIIKKKTSLTYQEFMLQRNDQKQWKPSMWVDEMGRLVINDQIKKAHLENNKPILSPEAVTKVVSSTLNISAEMLYGSSRNHMVCQKRAVLVVFLLKYSGLNLNAVGRLLGRSPGTLSRQIAKVDAYGLALNQIQLTCDALLTS